MIQPQYNPAYYQQPSSAGASAVNIQIFEPKAYGSAPAPAPMPQMPQYDAQLYNYPQASVYGQGMPYAPYQQYPQIPAYYPPAPYQQYPQAPYQQYQQQYQQAPSMPEPQMMPQSAIATEQPQPQQPAAQPAAPVVEQPQQQAANVVDVAALNGELTSQDLNQQTEAITKIAQMSQADSSTALQLVDNQVMQNLAAIIQKDTAQLPGPTNEQVAAAQKLQKGEQLNPAEQQLIEQSSPKEMAEKNKVFSMFTLAMLQKLQRDEIDQFNAQAGNAGNAVPPLKMQDLIGFNEIANIIATSQIPAVKAAGIQALSYVAKPEDLQIMQQILSPLANDKEEIVKQAAQEALTKLSAPAQQPQAASVQG